MFDDLEDFQSFSHRPGNFIPPNVDEIIKLSFSKAANQAKDLFYKMKRDTDRKRLAADVEIKVPPPTAILLTKFMKIFSRFVECILIVLNDRM